MIGCPARHRIRLAPCWPTRCIPFRRNSDIVVAVSAPGPTITRNTASAGVRHEPLARCDVDALAPVTLDPKAGDIALRARVAVRRRPTERDPDREDQLEQVHLRLLLGTPEGRGRSSDVSRSGRTSAGRLLASGTPVALGSRAFDLLVAMIERRNRVVVGKDELLAAVWPGMVVEESNLTVQVSALRSFLMVVESAPELELALSAS